MFSSLLSTCGDCLLVFTCLSISMSIMSLMEILSTQEYGYQSLIACARKKMLLGSNDAPLHDYF